MSTLKCVHVWYLSVSRFCSYLRTNKNISELLSESSWKVDKWVLEKKKKFLNETQC